MYPDVSYVYPKCILDSFGIRVKYMQNVKIHVFSWNVTEHVRYVWDTSRYIRIRVSCRIHAGYIRIRILITNPPKLDNKPPLTPRGEGQRCRVAHNLPRVSPLEIDQDAHRLIPRTPLGLEISSSGSPDTYPPGIPYAQYPKRRETSPRISLPPGRAPDGPPTVSSHGGSRSLNCWGQAAFQTSFHNVFVW